MDQSGYTIAIRYLARRPRSEKEVREKLQNKNIPDEQIHSIIKKLQDQNFLNDEEFATWWIEQRTQYSIRGWNIIIMELKQKGISDTLVRRLEEKKDALRGKNEKELAMQIAVKRYAAYKGLPEGVLYRKLGSYLARRGFDYGIIKACIDEILGK